MNKTNTIQYVEIKNQKHGAAALLSFLIPGLGQLVRGKIFSALFFFFVIVITFPTIILPLFFWVWCVKDAYN